jgi:hypothetical protein
MRTTDRRDLIDLMRHDHGTVAALFARLDLLGWHPARRRALTDVIVAELMRHAASATRYLYPTVRRCLPDGADIDTRARAGYRRTEWIMSDLMGTDVEHPEFAALLRRLAAEVSELLRQEATVLARLRVECPPQKLTELGRKVLDAERSVPTRPHPAVRLNRIMRRPVGWLDRIADALTDRPTTVDEL